MNKECKAFEYAYSNIGQFRAIMTDLGAIENYYNRCLKYTIGGQVFQTTFSEIKGRMLSEDTLIEAKNTSIQHIIDVLQKNDATIDNFKDILEKEKISVINWGSDDNIMYTFIDHLNQVTFRGNELLEKSQELDFSIETIIPNLKANSNSVIHDTCISSN